MSKKKKQTIQAIQIIGTIIILVSTVIIMRGYRSDGHFDWIGLQGMILISTYFLGYSMGKPHE